MRTIVTVLLLLVLTACANTQFKTYEARTNLFEGRGGTKEVVDGMEVWDNGDPPRKFKILGIIEDERPGGLIPMSQLKGDVVKKAKESGGDAVVHLSSNSQITGAYTQGYASGYASGNTAQVTSSSYTGATRRHSAKYAVVKYLD